MRRPTARILVVAVFLGMAAAAAPTAARAQEGLTPDLINTALTGHAFRWMTDNQKQGTRILWKYNDASAKWSPDGKSLTIDARIGLLNTKVPQGQESQLLTQHLVVRYDPDTRSVKVETAPQSQGGSSPADWAAIKKEFPDDDFFKNGGNNQPQTTATPALGFSAIVRNNWTVAREKDAIRLKRTRAITKAPCGWDASVDASIVARYLGKSDKTKTEAEALAAAQAAFKARRQGGMPNDPAVGLIMIGGIEGAAGFFMGDFKGAIADFALWCSRGRASMEGYTPETFGSNGTGQVVRAGEVIQFDYSVSGRGCWDISSRPYLVAQGEAAQKEARQILMNLRWDAAASTVALPYFGPKYDGTDVFKPVKKPDEPKTDAKSKADSTSKPDTTPLSQREAATLSNGGNVLNGPTAPTVITLKENYVLTFISTYHWNNGRGTPKPGTIALRGGDGTVYGPWKTTGVSGQGGAPNADWEARPNIALPPGSYTVIDSDLKTWAQNPESGGRGFIVVKGHAK
jgi:hypothetical protein